MKYCLILALALAVASADDRCAWGESYWCITLENAKECGAFQHCLTTVWKNEKLEQDGSEICTYCENVISDVRGFITDKHTMDQLKQFMESACSIIPVGEVSTKCKQMVDQYLPELFAMLEKDLDPQMICSLLGLCRGLKDTVQHHPMNTLHRVPLIKVPKGQADPICADCKKLLNDIKKDLTSAETEKEVVQLLEENLCKQMQFLAEECNNLVENYVPQIMDMLASQFDPNMICELLGFCNRSSSTPKALLSKMRLTKSPIFQAGQVVGNGAGCEICKTVITEIQSMTKDKMTQEELEAYIKKELCDKLGLLKDACEETVDEYGPELFELIYEELDPSVVCQSLGLCSAGRLFNAIQPVIVQEKLMQKQPAQQVQSVGDSTECTLCVLVVTKMDEMLSENATEAEIEAALDKVCSLLPSTIAQECRDFVDTYAAGILALLSQELDPKMVCASLGLCKESQISGSRLEAGGAGTCEVCKLMMQYLETLLTQNSTMDEIEHILEKLCGYLPKHYTNKCDELVEKYEKTIIQLLSQFADPNMICRELSLCDGNNVSEVPMVELVPQKEKIVPKKANLLGSNECTYGPAYWCASRQNAEKCKAVAHCKKHVWKN